jgi:hypothetical protein
VAAEAVLGLGAAQVLEARELDGVRDDAIGNVTRAEEVERRAQRSRRIPVHRLVAQERERVGHPLRRVPMPVEREHLLDAVARVAHERGDRPVERVDASRRLEVRRHERVAHVAAEQQHALAAVRRLGRVELAPVERVDHRRAVVVEAGARQAGHRGQRVGLEQALRRQAVVVDERLADQRAQPRAPGLRVGQDVDVRRRLRLPVGGADASHGRGDPTSRASARRSCRASGC